MIMTQWRAVSIFALVVTVTLALIIVLGVTLLVSPR